MSTSYDELETEFNPKTENTKSTEPEVQDSQDNSQDNSYDSLVAEFGNSPTSPEGASLEKPREEMKSPDVYTTVAVNFAEGITGGLSGEIAGGISALGTLVDEDHSFADVAAIYRKNRDTLDSVRIRGNREYPITGFVSEMVGGVGLGLATLGTGAAATSVGGAAKLGALTGFGKSEGFDPLEIGKGAVLGAATQGVFNKIFGTGPASMTSNQISRQEKDSVLKMFNIKSAGEFGTSSVEKQAVGALGKRGAQMVQGTAGDVSVSAAEVAAKDALAPEGMDIFKWAEEIVNVPGTSEKIAMPGDTASTVYDRITQKALPFIENELSVAIAQPDLLLTQAGGSVNTAAIVERGMKVLNNFNNIDGKKAALEVFQELKVRPQMTLAEAQAFRTRLSSSVNYMKNGSNNAEQLARQLNGIVREELTNTMKRVAGPEAVDQFNKASRAYGNFKLAQSLMELPARSANLGNVAMTQSKVMNALRKFSASYALNQKAGMVNAAVEGLKAAMFETTASLSGKRLQSLSKIANHLEKNPGRWQEQAVRILQASTRTAEHFQQELGYVESLMDLSEFPVERTTNDLVMKLPQVLNVLSDKAPDKAATLLKAVQSGDEREIGAIMSELGRLRESQGMIAAGIGWNGKAATSQDISDWEGQIKNSGQNHTVRMRQLEQLRKFGTGPVFEQKTDYIKNTVMSKRVGGKKQGKL